MGRFTQPDPTVTDCSTAHLTDITLTVNVRTDSETPLPLLAYWSVLLVGVRTEHTINDVAYHSHNFRSQTQQYDYLLWSVRRQVIASIYRITRC